MKKKIFLLTVIIIMILLVSYTYSDTARYLMKDTVYFLKANDCYVSMRYSINIENSTKSGKDFAFWGQDKKTNQLTYVMYLYHRGVYIVEGNKGITLEEAYKVATKNDIEPLDISLVVINLFRDDNPIVEYMYWISEYENAYSEYIRFLDGEVVEDPFRVVYH